MDQYAALVCFYSINNLWKNGVSIWPWFNLHLSICIFLGVELETALSSKSTNDNEIESLKKQLGDEKMKKIQAVNKLAEIMNRKDMSGRARKVSSTDLRMKEKECRKLQHDLKQVSWSVASSVRVRLRGNVIISWNVAGTCYVCNFFRSFLRDDHNWIKWTLKILKLNIIKWPKEKNIILEKAARTFLKIRV